MPSNRAAMSLVSDEEDQVPRLERFRAAHPEIVILLLDAWPKAWLNGQKIEPGPASAFGGWSVPGFEQLPVPPPPP